MHIVYKSPICERAHFHSIIIVISISLLKWTSIIRFEVEKRWKKPRKFKVYAYLII